MVRHVAATGTPIDLAALGYNGRTWDQPALLSRGQLTTGERMPSVELLPVGQPVWVPDGPALDMDAMDFTDPLTGRAMTGAQFLDRRMHTDALLVIHRGRLVYETYRNGMLPTDRHVNHSTTKTLTTMLVGIAVDDGVLDVEAPMQDLVPALAPIDAWRGITLQHVLDMAVGLDIEEHYEDPDSMYWRYATAVRYYEPSDAPEIGALAFAVNELTRVLEPPGHRFNYASYLTNLIPLAVGNAYGIPPLELMEARIYARVGAQQPALMNVDSMGHPIVEGQLNLTLRDFARWSLPFLREGLALTGDRIVPPEWIDATLQSSTERRKAFERSDYRDNFPFPQMEYHNQAWILDPGQRIMTMLGIHGQFCYLDLGRDLMITGYSSFPDQVHPVMGATMTQIWSRVTDALT